MTGFSQNLTYLWFDPKYTTMNVFFVKMALRNIQGYFRIVTTQNTVLIQYMPVVNSFRYVAMIILLDITFLLKWQEIAKIAAIKGNIK